MIWEFQAIVKLTTALLLHYYRKLLCCCQTLAYLAHYHSLSLSILMDINFENISILGSGHMDLLVHVPITWT